MNPLLQELLFERISRSRRRHLLEACSVTLKAEQLSPLVEHLKTNPKSDLGLSLLMGLATKEQVQALWQTWLQCETPPSGALELAGLHRLQEACPVAWKVAQEGDWHEQCEAILCLANLELTALAPAIRKKLDKMEGQALFLELFPSLAPKVEWPDTLDRLRRWASHASTDCLGGIITGISLCNPEKASTVFEELLRNPRFELFGGGTGLEGFSESSGHFQIGL